MFGRVTVKTYSYPIRRRILKTSQNSTVNIGAEPVKYFFLTGRELDGVPLAGIELFFLPVLWWAFNVRTADINGETPWPGGCLFHPANPDFYITVPL